MGKKGNWFSVLKRVLTSSSKVSEKKSASETKGRRSKHGEVNSFIPLYREPSSIEKILGDAEREQLHKISGNTGREQQNKTPLYAEKEKETKFSGNPEREQNQRLSIVIGREQQHKIPRNGGRKEEHKILEAGEKEQPDKYHYVTQKKAKKFKTPMLKHATSPNSPHVSAIKIQAAYRGYTARKSYRALKGLLRLQGVMRGQSVKRQTMNTMRCMQLLVRVQSQIRTRRLQMMEIKSIQHQKSDKEADSTLSKWSSTHQSGGEDHEGWDDSMLTKEEIDARMQRKVEAVIKRERALAYAYSHQLLKVTPKSAQAVLSDVRSSGNSWWWSWLERQVPPSGTPIAARPRPTTPAPASTSAIINRPSSGNPRRPTLDGASSTVPFSSKPLPSPRAKQQHHHPNRWQQPALRDDESMTSCPPAYAAAPPRYMAPTVSAKAKVKGHLDGEVREGKRRFMFGLGSSIGSMKWGKGGSSLAGQETGSRRAPSTGRHKSTHSIGGLSVDSTVSLPVGVGRKPFR